LFFQGINLLLRELDQFVAKLFSIVRFHDLLSGRSTSICDDRVRSKVGANERNGGCLRACGDKRPEVARRGKDAFLPSK
jgi:hypothetical protein